MVIKVGDKRMKKLKRTQIEIYSLWGTACAVGVIGSASNSVMVIYIMIVLVVVALMLQIARLRCPYCDHQFIFWILPHHCPGCGKSLIEEK